MTAEREKPAPMPPGSRPAGAPEPDAEQAYSDWQRRLAGNLARRSDGRWDPLTHPAEPPTP